MRPTACRAFPGAPPAVILVAALCALPAPAVALDIPPLRSTQPPYFTADLAVTLDKDQQPGLSVTITVPYQEMEWVRVDGSGGSGRLGAGVEFSVVFESQRGDRHGGDVWERRVVVADQRQSRTPNAVVSEKRVFPVPPGKSRVRIAVRDLNSQATSAVQQKLEIPDYARLPVGFADLELGVTDSTGAFRPVLTRSFGTDAARICARAALLDRRAGEWPRRYQLRYRIRDDGGEVIVEGRQEVTLAASGDQVIVSPSAPELFLGSYVFEVELVEGKSRWKVERSFDVEESGPPRGREFERLLEPLSYIATPEEMDWLRALPAEQQAAGWETFWDRRDPTPETARNEVQLEFFRRVKYAEHHFQGFGPGWRSDMGRIYIKFGPPDQIENRPATVGSPQQEIWYYHQPYRRLVFVDREGFGRYTLLNPSAE